MIVNFLKIAAALTVLPLAACSAVDRIENIGQAPQLSAVGNPAGQQIVAQIPASPPIVYPNNSLWQPGAQNFFRDPRASKVGDVITVNVSVSDAAKLSNTSSRSRANKDSASMDNLFGLESVMPSAMTPSSLVKMGSDMSNTGTGAVARSESINLTLAALVAQVMPNGNLVIDGHQQVRVNNELRDLRVSGIVRREDISQGNTIGLTQIAEARISYGGKGLIADVQQPRYGSQLLDIIMPW